MHKYYGWYSARQAAMVGELVYPTPGGGEVTVTSITVTPVHNMGFSDVKECGEVVSDPSQPCRRISVGYRNKPTVWRFPKRGGQHKSKHKIPIQEKAIGMTGTDIQDDYPQSQKDG